MIQTYSVSPNLLDKNINRKLRKALSVITTGLILDISCFLCADPRWNNNPQLISRNRHVFPKFIFSLKEILFFQKSHRITEVRMI
jgi:hypothetical protein